MTAFHELARISAEGMLNGLILGLAIALFVQLILQVMGRRNSSTRFAVWLAALFFIAALPLLNVVKGAPGRSGGAVWAVTVPNRWATYIVAAWAVIALVGLSRVASGLWQLRKVRTGSEIIDPVSLDSVLQKTLGEFQPSGRMARLAVSEKISVPAAIGFFHPMIVLPQWALKELSSAELNSILIHEMAHLRRRDDWTNLAQKVLRAVLFFHPAVWWVERQLSLAREMACDDIVLSRTANPRAYAECLVNVAERSFMRRGLALAQAAVSKMRQTTLRVSQILDGNRSAATRVWKPALGLVAVASGVLVAGLARAPELVAFRDSAPAAAMASVTVPTSLPNSAPRAAEAVLASFRPKRTGHSRSVAAPAIEAKVAPQHAQDSMMKATLATFKQDESAPQTVLVVMRTEQFGPSGPSWTVRVWRFTVLKAEQIPLELTIPSKSL
jgi:beta-lactamase regulating signal transducer with metallopeptidase domain